MSNHKIRERINWKKESSLLPGYIIITLWILFTFVLIGWIGAASLSTTKDIFLGRALQFPTGLHFENYAKAWTSQNVSVFFTNSLLYSIVSVSLLVMVAAPASYVLSRFKFAGNRLVQNGFVAAMGVPVVMIILPLLPDRAIDPWGGFNPREIWFFTVLIATISFAGYIAVRVLGPSRGLLVSSLAGALASSTAVTVALSYSPLTLPSIGSSFSSSPTIFRSTPNTARPCLACTAMRSSALIFRCLGISVHTVPSGLVSVMPQACSTSTP